MCVSLVRHGCYQDHLDLRTVREQRRDDLVDADGIRRGTVETGHARPLQTIFGAVEVTRLAYRRRGGGNLYPGDAALNLPRERHSHGLRELSADRVLPRKLPRSPRGDSTGQWACSSASVSSNSSRHAPPPTSRPSTPSPRAPRTRPPKPICWSCPRTARAS